MVVVYADQDTVRDTDTDKVARWLIGKHGPAALQCAEARADQLRHCRQIRAARLWDEVSVTIREIQRLSAR